MMKYLYLIRKGMFSRNPVFFLILGLYPTLAVTTSLENGLGMGLSALIVLILSNTVISMIRKLIPEQVRIPVQIVIIATFVTIIAMLLEAYVPELFGRLGIYIPLIVVNCIILARADAFARKNPVPDAAADGLGMGLGFMIALVLIGSLREIIGTSGLALMGNVLFTLPTEGALIMILPPGALFTIGFILAAINMVKGDADA